MASISAIFHHDQSHGNQSAASLPPHGGDGAQDLRKIALENSHDLAAPLVPADTFAQRRQKINHHVSFTKGDAASTTEDYTNPEKTPVTLEVPNPISAPGSRPVLKPGAFHSDSWRVEPQGLGPKTPALQTLNSPSYKREKELEDHISVYTPDLEHARYPPFLIPTEGEAHPKTANTVTSRPVPSAPTALSAPGRPTAQRYTSHLRTRPAKTFRETLKPWNGRLRPDNWLKAAIRPFILFAYPAILWSTLVYSFSITWLIILSETVSTIFRDRETYNFSALGVGLVYISAFIGGVIGTAVAGKASDFVVRAMSRKNGGVYEPEFRLVMAIPVAISTGIGLMGFGWSAQERDAWIVPTLFFGILSFGCSLGSTTAITFAVDSYRQYAGEALVTLNFSKSKLPASYM